MTTGVYTGKLQLLGSAVDPAQFTWRTVIEIGDRYF